MNVSAWLAIAAVNELRPELLSKLLREYGDAETIVAARSRELAAHSLGETAIRKLRLVDREKLALTETWLAQSATHLVTWDDSRYPALLKTLPDAPKLLYVHGNPDSLGFPMFAIVGSRNPTRGGEATAREFAAELSAAGLAIASGLALGIDAAAHAGALQAGGLTLAVVGTGVDRVYPAANSALAHEIAKTGALISDFPLGTEPRRENFPQRNRLISGLSIGTLVVEAAERSGSLITARLAAEQGREVFAVPGSIHNPMSRGCHRLIRDGARLVESTADIFAELGAFAELLQSDTALNPPDCATPEGEAGADKDRDYAALLEALSWEPCSSDEISARSGLTIAEVCSMLLILELEGVVEALPGGRYARLKQAHQNS